jgi:hypothetical protein
MDPRILGCEVAPWVTRLFRGCRMVRSQCRSLPQQYQALLLITGLRDQTVICITCKYPDLSPRRSSVPLHPSASRESRICLQGIIYVERRFSGDSTHSTFLHTSRFRIASGFIQAPSDGSSLLLRTALISAMIAL